MEELRPVLVDRLALSLVNRSQISERDFTIAASGAVTLTDDARKRVLVSYQKRKHDELVHPFINEKTSLGLIPFIQTKLMTRHPRDDLDAYPPFLWQ